MDVRMPDGTIISNVPEGISRADLVAKLKANGFQFRQPDALDDPNMAVAGMSDMEKFRAGVGQAMNSVGQALSFASKDKVDETKKRDAPLMNTGAGAFGGLVVNIAATAPAAFIPGANTILGAGLIGGGVGALTTPGDITDRATGAVLGSAGGMAGQAIPRAFSVARAAAEPLTDKGQNAIVGRVMNRVAGDNAPAVTARLRGATELVPGSAPTAAEVANSGGIAALQRAMSQADPEAYATRGVQQNEARINLLNSMAGNQATRDAAVLARNNETADLRNLALSNANYGTNKTAELTNRISGKNDSIVGALQDQGRFSTIAAQQDALANGWTPVPGMPRVPGRYSANAERIPEAAAAASETAAIVAQRKAERDFLERQLNSLSQSGYSPLKSSSIVGQIEGTLSEPGIRASSVAMSALDDVKQKIASVTDRFGNIDARDLYTIRKEVGNSISKFAKDNQNWDKRFTAGLERDIQGSIDSAITKAGAGDLWGRYLAKYQELSKPINQMDILQAIKDSSIGKADGILKPSAFARSLSDDTAKSATGFEKSTLEGVLSPAQLAALNAIKQDLSRSVSARDLGRGVGSNTFQNFAMDNLTAQMGMPRAVGGLLGMVPGMSPTATLLARGAGAVGNRAYKSADEAIRARMAQALLNPQEAAALMESAAKPGTLQGLLMRMPQRVQDQIPPEDIIRLLQASPGLLGASASSAYAHQ